MKDVLGLISFKNKFWPVQVWLWVQVIEQKVKNLILKCIEEYYYVIYKLADHNISLSKAQLPLQIYYNNIVFCLM